MGIMDIKVFMGYRPGSAPTVKLDKKKKSYMGYRPDTSSVPESVETGKNEDNYNKPENDATKNGDEETNRS